mmetsp:Transcript_79354/g.222043  ORF Transcript_79354/g.222043 Transcript_79354/m.222043 type:complete len:234 (-) Transcript_79354:167-868(-)
MWYHLWFNSTSIPIWIDHSSNGLRVLTACVGFTILRDRLTTPSHRRHTIQHITFIRSIDPSASRKPSPLVAFQGDAPKDFTSHFHCADRNDVAHDSYTGFIQHLIEDALPDMALKKPSRWGVTFGVPCTCWTARILQFRTYKKLARDALNYSVVSRICVLQPARQHATNVSTLRKQHHMPSTTSRCRNCSNTSCACRTIHQYVGCFIYTKPRIRRETKILQEDVLTTYTYSKE